MENNPNSREVQQWRPPGLHQVVGLAEIKDFLVDGLRSNGRTTNLLIDGSKGSGKTAIIQGYVQTLHCYNTQEGNWVPCRTCQNCREFDVCTGDQGLFAYFREAPGRGPIHYRKVNCGAVTEAELKSPDL